MTDYERRAQQMLQNVDNLEGAPLGTSSGVGLSVTGVSGEAAYKAQVDLQTKIVYSGSTLGEIGEGLQILNSLSNLPSVLRTPAPVFIFGYSDNDGGYNKARQLLPNTGGWLTTAIEVVKSDTLMINVTDGASPSENWQYTSAAVRNGIAKVGDMIKIDVNVSGVAGSGTVFVRETIITCPQVAYGTLLSSIASDTFVYNMIKYFIPDTTKVNQFSNTLTYITQSLFGKTTNDTLNPSSMINEFSQTPNLRVIKAGQKIDKAKSLCFYQNYDCQEIQLSFFIPSVAVLK